MKKSREQFETELKQAFGTEPLPAWETAQLVLEARVVMRNEMALEMKRMGKKIEQLEKRVAMQSIALAIITGTVIGMFICMIIGG